MWKQYLHIPGAVSFIPSEQLETSCGVVSSLLEEREDSAEEDDPAIISYKSSEDFCGENGACRRYNLATKVLMPVLLSSFSGDLGTQYHYIWQVQAKFLYAELPYVSTGTSRRRGHTLGMTKWAEEN